MDFLRKTLAFMTMCLHSATGESFQAIQGCKRDYTLVSSLSQRFRTRSLSECAVLCAGSKMPCASFNVCQKTMTQTGSRERECELLTTLTGGNCSLLQYTPGCNYKEKRIPCVNGTINITEVKCVCLPGFAGQACDRYYRDCREGTDYGMSGVVDQLLQPLEASKPFLSQCKFDWGLTVVLRRKGIVPCSSTIDIFTTATWSQLQETMGDCQCHCFIGLRNLYYLLKSGVHTLKIYLNYASWSLTADRYYQNFSVGDESTNYTVSYTSTAADVPSPSTAGHGFAPGGQWRFCTQDRDCSGCAQATGFPGWFDYLCACPRF